MPRIRQNPTTRPSSPPNRVLVWDIPTRVFHWSLAGTVFLALGSALLGPESALGLHTIAGYIIGLLVAFRLVWGIVGGRYSRFRHFPLSPKDLRHHVRQLRDHHCQMPLGHNPAGSWMILLLLSLLVALVASGALALGGQENLGPLAAWVDFRNGQKAASLHAILAWALIGAIALHVSAVLIGTRLLKLPLISAMINGHVLTSPENEGDKSLLIGRGLMVLGLVTSALAIPSTAMTTLPSSGWHAIPISKTYQAACSECHNAHHPSLHTAGDWRKIIAGLSNHFGENAILDMATAAEIQTFLVANSSETFDTEAANLIGHASVPSLRITNTPAWKIRHANLSTGIFKNRQVGSAINCNACHKDADQGRFDDQAIALPKGISK